MVTGQGEILELNKGLEKNATGPDLRHLFIGSEGLFGFIVEATMKLCQPPKPLQVMLLAVDNAIKLTQLATLFHEKLTLTAFEFFSDNALNYVLKQHALQQPLSIRSPFYALVEYEANDETTILNCFEKAMNDKLVNDGIVSQNETQAHELWQYREHITESIAALKPYKNDLAVLVSKMPQFIEDLDQLIKKDYANFEIVLFGHIGDGNLHLNIIKPETMPYSEFLTCCHEVDHKTFALIEKYQGSISAEHGIGLIKKDYLHYSKSTAEINYIKQLKKCFDPDNILNPGKVI